MVTKWAGDEMFSLVAFEVRFLDHARLLQQWSGTAVDLMSGIGQGAFFSKLAWRSFAVDVERVGVALIQK